MDFDTYINKISLGMKKYQTNYSEDIVAIHANFAYKAERDEGYDEKNKLFHSLDTSIEFTSPKERVSLQSVTYTWENIEVETDIVKGNCRNKQVTRKRILDNVTGAVRPGEFLAIMGASGAGKTTLLNCLTFRNTGAMKVKGARLLNGAPVKPDRLARISGYVQQEDLFIGTLRVDEVLRFQALLRMDKHFTYAERMERVEQLIQEFGLSKCRKTLIGDPEKGIKSISGGEKKRLAFACEILTNPPLMFCDEPTSGLDSFMAQNIVQALKNLASAGKTVICTIHQPSSEVFAMFDRILLMAEGRTAFLGPIEDAPRFFASNGLPCPMNYNPADFYIFSLATVSGREAESRERIKAICDAYDASEAASQVAAVVENQKSVRTTGQFDDDTNKMKKSPYKANWSQQFSAILWRSFISAVRDPQIIYVKRSASLVIALFIALIYQGQSMDASSIISIQGVLFLFLTNATFENVTGVIETFAFELPIFMREHSNGMYRVDAYFVSKSVAELGFYIVFPFVFFAIPYYIVGLNPDVDRFFTAGGIIILVANVSTSLGYFISCLSGSPKLALAITPGLITPMLLFGGLFLENGSVPGYINWLSYLSWFLYGNEALSVNQWDGVEFNNTDCQYLGYNVTTLPEGIPNATVEFIKGLYLAYEENVICSGNDILDSLNFNPDFFTRDILCLIALMVLLRIMAFFALLHRTYKKK